MSWISVAVAAVCGVLAALIAALAAKGFNQNKPLFAGVFGGTIAFFLIVSHFYVTPSIKAHYEAGMLDRTLSGNAAFAAIKKHDPEAYAHMTAELRAGLLHGRDKAELIELVRGEITTLVQQRLPHASDEAATEYMRVMVREMGELRSKGSDLCYKFLFAQAGHGLDLSKYVSANTMEADLSALGEVVRTSAVAPQPVPQPSEVMSRLQPVFAALSGRHGQDVTLLQHPQAPGVDRDKLCMISIDMYTLILQAPPDESGKLIRFLMGQGG